MPRKKKRAQSGQGTFRIKPSGLIEYRITYKDPYGKSCRKSYSCATRQECLDKADAFLSGRHEIKPTLNENISIVDIFLNSLTSFIIILPPQSLVHSLYQIPAAESVYQIR